LRKLQSLLKFLKVIKQYYKQQAQSEASVDSDVLFEEIDLPSRGHFYPENHPLASGKIKVKYMTAKEEDILNDQDLIKKGTALDKLLDSLIVTQGVSLDDVLIGDKNAIFIAARILAYGKEYSFKFKDPDSDEEVEETVDLTQIPQKEFDFDKYEKGKNSFEFQLPFSKRNLTFRLLSHREEKSIDAEVKQVAKMGKKSSKVSPEVTTRLKYLITSVDGDANAINIRKFVDSMLSRDALELRKHVKEISPDLDMTFEYNDHELNIPIGVGFFWPDVDV
jgi:hypothetical protein